MRFKLSTALMAIALFAGSPTAATASPQVKDSTQDSVVVFINEAGQVDSIKTPTAVLSGARSGERAPDCIRAQAEKGFVQVYNDCPFDLRVKVIFAFGFDSACKLVIAGTRTNIAPHSGRIDGIETC